MLRFILKSGGRGAKQEEQGWMISSIPLSRSKEKQAFHGKKETESYYYSINMKVTDARRILSAVVKENRMFMYPITWYLDVLQGLSTGAMWIQYLRWQPRSSFRSFLLPSSSEEWMSVITGGIYFIHWYFSFRYHLHPSPLLLASDQLWIDRMIVFRQFRIVTTLARKEPTFGGWGWWVWVGWMVAARTLRQRSPLTQETSRDSSRDASLFLSILFLGFPIALDRWWIWYGSRTDRKKDERIRWYLASYLPPALAYSSLWMGSFSKPLGRNGSLHWISQCFSILFHWRLGEMVFHEERFLQGYKEL